MVQVINVTWQKYWFKINLSFIAQVTGIPSFCNLALLETAVTELHFAEPAWIFFTGFALSL